MPVRSPLLAVAPVISSLILAGFAYPVPPDTSGLVLEAGRTGQQIVLDGEIEDWRDIPGIVVSLTGTGGPSEVELRAAVRADRIYLLAVWQDRTKDVQHKPYVWNEAMQAYDKAERMEDRFAIAFAKKGKFTANKLDGSEFEADKWHWKAARSNPAGLAHDKHWKVSRTPFEGGREFQGADGGSVYLARPSDAGDQLYKPTRYYLRQADVMPGYEINMQAQGSVADVKAKGVWRDGYWYLELSRLLETGHDDDTAFPSEGTVEIAVAVFDGISHNVVDGGMHSYSGKFVLRFSTASS
jgi:hypothetical protein